MYDRPQLCERLLPWSSCLYVGLVNCSSVDIVPGDILEISSGMNMPCDVVLFSGSATLNEAMLTGESVPVIKTEYPRIGNPGDVYSVDDDKKYTLYSGTKVMETRQAGDTPVELTLFHRFHITDTGTFLLH